MPQALEQGRMHATILWVQKRSVQLLFAEYRAMAAVAAEVVQLELVEIAQVLDTFGVGHIEEPQFIAAELPSDRVRVREGRAAEVEGEAGSHPEPDPMPAFRCIAHHPAERDSVEILRSSIVHRGHAILPGTAGESAPAHDVDRSAVLLQAVPVR